MTEIYVSDRDTRETPMSLPFRRSLRRLQSRSVIGVCIAMAILAALSACGGEISSDHDKAKGGDEVVLVTYDSFVLPEGAADEFKRRTGATIRVLESGDSSEMLATALLSAGAPQGDVIFGIDSTLASRAVDSDLLDVVDPAISSSVPQRYALDGEGSSRLLPISHGEVCMNVDSSWFAAKARPEPSTLADLAEAEFRDLTVVSSPVTSGPGLAFLVGTVAEFGEDGWLDYWKRLKDNGVLVRPSWSDAYYNEYTVSGGDRPIVLSYASSPPAEVIFSEGKRSEPVSTVMKSSCVAQVEYAGVLRGAKHRDLAEDLLRFMVDPTWQIGLPLANFVYPVIDVELPQEFKNWAPVIDNPLSLEPSVISRNREGWIEAWRTVME